MKPSIPLKDLVVVSMPNPTEINAPVKPWQGMPKPILKPTKPYAMHGRQMAKKTACWCITVPVYKRAML